MTLISVGIANLKIAEGDCLLSTSSLGSCVAIILYDRLSKTGGLAHIMLPDSAMVKTGINPAKFANTAICELIRKLEEKGIPKNRLKAWIIGGANMFPSSPAQEPIMTIGERNIMAARKGLEQAGINIIKEDTGKSHGRTVEFCIQTGEVLVKSAILGIKKL